MSRTCRIAPPALPVALATFLTVFWLASHSRPAANSCRSRSVVFQLTRRGRQEGERRPVGRVARAERRVSARVRRLEETSAAENLAAAARGRHRRAPQDGTPISDEMRYLAGLQRIQYVFVYPDRTTSCMAGPAKAGSSTPRAKSWERRPIAPCCCWTICWWRSRRSRRLRQTGISCSIDPTAEGLVALQRYLQNTAHRAGTIRARDDGHRGSAGPANDHRDGRARPQPFRPRAGGGRLSDEAAGDGLRAIRRSPGCPDFLQMVKAVGQAHNR